MLRKKKQVILVVSLLLVTGFLVTSLASYHASRASLRSEIAFSELPLTSDNVYSEIQRDLLPPIFISSLMANDTFLRDWAIEGERDTNQIVRYLKEIREKYHAFTSFFVSEKTRNYYQSDGILKKVKKSEERDKWYFRVREMEPLYETNIDPDMANKDTMTIFINYKVFDYNQNFIGATGIGLEIRTVRQLIESYQRRYKRNIFFINRQGDIVLHSPTFSGEATNIRHMEGLSALADKILMTESSTLQYEKSGDTIHLNTRFIPDFDWYLLVEQSEKDALKNIHKALWINLAICTLITLIVLFITNLTITGYQKKLEKMATTDKLTGTFNRQGFDILLDQTLKESPRKRTALSLILLDVDRFKRINDTLGHSGGDNVLRHIVQTTRQNIRNEDVLSRWGGEEFLILLKECDLANAFLLAEKIRKAIKNAPFRFNGREIPVTISLGVAEHKPGEGIDALFNRVDRMLYLAKQNGRDRSEKEEQTHDNGNSSDFT
jgi:diguanylate cyclase (GGDEF)-like protein